MNTKPKKQTAMIIIIIILLSALAITIVFSSARIKTLEATAFNSIGREYGEIYYMLGTNVDTLSSEIEDYLQTGNIGSLHTAGVIASRQSRAWSETGVDCFRYVSEVRDLEHRKTLRYGDIAIDIDYASGALNDISDCVSRISDGFDRLNWAVRYIMTEGREYPEFAYSYSDCVDYLKNAVTSLNLLAKALMEGQEKYLLHDIANAWTEDDVIKLMALWRDLSDFAPEFRRAMQFSPAYTEQAKIERAIIQFYENKDIGAEYDLSWILDEDIADYLTDKIMAERLAAERYGTYKENYTAELRLISKQPAEDNAEYKYQVITTYTLSGKDFDTTVSEEVIVRYDREKDRITDFYTSFCG